MEKLVPEWVPNLALGEEEEAMLFVPQVDRAAVVTDLQAEEDPLRRHAKDEEKRLEWKLRLARERTRRVEAADNVEKELRVVEEQQGQLATQVDLQRKIELMSQNMDVMLRAQQEQLHYLRGHDIALQSMRMGFKDFAREMMMRVGTKMRAALENTILAAHLSDVGDPLCIPNSVEIRSLILGEYHDTEGHFGWQKTLANLTRAYTWPGMKADCIVYVRSCKHEREIARVTKNLRKDQHKMIEQANKHHRPSQFQELQEVYSAIEEAKADIVGLWALQYLQDKGVIPTSLERSMYVTFLAGCFRSVRFGLTEAHGKGQAVQFNYLLQKGGFVQNPDGKFAVDFSKIRGAVESLGREILVAQAEGNKAASKRLLDEYGVLTPALEHALAALKNIDVPVDIAPSFTSDFIEEFTAVM
ncbi:hypothetical protein CBR_g49132 [Chara braunii]|uniref:Integrase zinc-binding domain-containing protein n=1 Tax=Chara braunii TaxID=69332 RepID=A0A388K4S8_CHABU|nr:hypothetical protein CBR_g49132 [Chara braunii]|eukprot:GBG65060.1 hypothetical protein CBR_g49132 [Chara braunii]